MELTLVLVVVLRLLLGESGDYDERQNLDQGRAAKYALWTVLGYSLVWILYGTMEEERLLSTEMILLIGCAAALLVYLTIVIVRDAYVPANFGGFHWLLLLAGLAGFGGFFFRLRSGEVDWTGEKVTGWMALVWGAVMTWSAVLVIGKRLLQRFEKE